MKGVAVKPEGASLSLELMPRAAGRAEPVTSWRRDLAKLADQMAALIARNEDPERRYRTAIEVGQDIVYNTGLDLRRQYGRVFDPIIDGHETRYSAF